MSFVTAMDADDVFHTDLLAILGLAGVTSALRARVAPCPPDMPTGAPAPEVDDSLAAVLGVLWLAGVLGDVLPAPLAGSPSRRRPADLGRLLR